MQLIEVKMFLSNSSITNTTTKKAIEEPGVPKKQDDLILTSRRIAELDIVMKCYFPQYTQNLLVCSIKSSGETTVEYSFLISLKNQGV